MRKRWTVMAGAAFMAGCVPAQGVEADDAWIRLPAVAGRPAAGYVTLHGGPRPARLITVSADLAVRTEMHQSAQAGGMMTMQPLSAVPVPADTDTRFQPGGRHLMLFGLNPALKPGTSTILTFTFADGTRLQRKAWAIAAGAPAPD